MRRCLAMVTMILVLSVALVPPASADTGQFGLRCNRISHNAADDPIVHPGHPGEGHFHSFFGNRSTNADSTYRTMLGKPTTCDLSKDTAGYWFPALLERNGNVVPLKQVKVYYRGDERTVPFPRDFRMIAGWPDVRAGTNDVNGWTCDADDPLQPSPPNCGADWVRAMIHFPSCWDGQRTDSNDHRSHVVYPSGRCPAGHRVSVPRLVVLLTFATHSGSGLRLSSDMMEHAPAGSTLHADFWNTWDQPTLQSLVNRCLHGGQDCIYLQD